MSATTSTFDFLRPSETALLTAESPAPALAPALAPSPAAGASRTPCGWTDGRSVRRAVDDIVVTALDRVSALELDRQLSALRWATATARLSQGVSWCAQPALARLSQAS